MPSLLIVVFVLQLALHLINTIGANTINELLWILYNRFPTPTSASAQQATTLKREVIRLKRELGGVSAQDDFAKWAKLRRQYDKAVGEFKKIDSALRGHRNSFFSTLSTIRWLFTNGLRIALQFWYSKQPMFWIPEGWVPGYVEWVLSFPRAPKGSVSINIWDIACASIVKLVGEALTAVYVLVTKRPAPGAREEPMAFDAKPSARTAPSREKDL